MAPEVKETSYELLIRKLEEFAGKYHKNQFIRKGIYFLSLFLLSFLLIAIFEYFGHFNTTVRTGLFYGFLLLNIAAFTAGPLIPLLQMLKVYSGINHSEAARIIGAHFPEVRDKLLNTIQLHESGRSTDPDTSKTLIEAAINQRILQLRPIPFAMAVDIRDNFKYARYAAIPLLILLITFVAAPEALIDSTGRLIDHRSHYEKDMPFVFELQNDSLKAVRNQEFPIHLKVSGEVIPSEVMIEWNGTLHRMRNDGRIDFFYRIRNPQQTAVFRFYADGFYSRPYELRVYPRPSLENFTAFLDFPAYTGKAPEELENTGDLMVPEGTEITWLFRTSDVEHIYMDFEDTTHRIPPQKGRDFRFGKTVYADQPYSVRTANAYFTSRDSLRYFINVIPDEPPSIRVQKQSDADNEQQVYFIGEISDDYGFSALTFNYRFLETDASRSLEGELKSEPLQISLDETVQQFYFYQNLGELQIGKGDQVEFYFTVWDNDGVNGPKPTRSETFLYRAPTRRDIADESRRTREEIRSSFDENIDQLNRLRQEMQELQRNLMSREQMNWQDQQKVEEMIDRHRQIQNQLRELQQQQQQDLRQQQQFGDMTPEMQERQQRMQELMEELMNDDIRKLLEELQKALDEQNKDRIRQKLQELDQQDRYSEREMERLRELFKQLDFEQKLRENIEQLRDMAGKQDDLSQDTGKADASEEELSEEQQALQEEFEQFKEDMKDLEQQNEQLQHPKRMEDFDDQMQEIGEHMQESIDQLMQQNREGSQQQQQQGKDKMEDMADKMETMKMQMDMEAIFINYESLRRLLQNLLHFSFSQEELLGEFGKVQEYNPRYVELGRQQSRLERYARLIEDSLYSLSTRIMQIGPMVNQEMSEIHHNLNQALQNISDRRIGTVRRHQQQVMTSANNLAVLLSEIMENLQQQMAAQMDGQQISQQQMEDSGEPSMSKMQELQEELNQRMQDMQQQGEQFGEEGDNSEQMDEEYARIAAEQERIRRELRELRERMQDRAGDGGEELERIEEDMEKTEQELLNRRIDQETLDRQKEITVRMLEYEEAERTQDQREEREAEQISDYKPVRPEDLEQFFRERESNIERLQTMPPRLNYYYQQKVEEYFRKLSGDR